MIQNKEVNKFSGLKRALCIIFLLPDHFFPSTVNSDPDSKNANLFRTAFSSAKKDHKTMISSQILFCCLGPKTQPSC